MASLLESPGRKCPACCPFNCRTCPPPSTVPMPASMSPGREVHAAGETGYDSGPSSGCGSACCGAGAVKETAGKGPPRQIGFWTGGTIDSALHPLGSQPQGVVEMMKIYAALFVDWYQRASFETRAAIIDIRNLWMTTIGSPCQKAKVVHRLVAFYLVGLAIYIIEASFWFDAKVLETLCTVVFKSKSNSEMLKGVGIVLVFVGVLYLLGIVSSSCRN